MFRRFGALFALSLSLAACSRSSTPESLPAPEVGVVKARLDGNEAVSIAASSIAPSDGDRVSFVVRGPVIADQALLSETLSATWDAPFTLSQPPVSPERWTLRYFAGAAELPSTPSTPAQWASVTRISANGPVDSAGSSNGGQYVLGMSSATPPSAASAFPGEAPGGFNVFFSPDRTKVFSAHIADSPAAIMCRNTSDGSACSDAWPYAVYHTSVRATGFVDPKTQRLWHETYDNSGRGGWQCIETSGDIPSPCSTPFVSAFEGATNYNHHIDLQNVGRELYSLDVLHGALTCLNLDGNDGVGAPCEGQPYGDFAGASETHATDQSAIKAIAGKIYVLINKELECFDPSTKAKCAGMQWPQTGDLQPITAVPSADGVVRNLCTRSVCYALDGTSSTLTSGYGDFIDANPPSSCCGDASAGGDTVGPRVFYPYQGNQMQCYDAMTDARCAGFPISVPGAYSAVVDPLNANCLWTNGDDGVIRTWNALDGEPGCTAPPPTVTFRPEVAVPRLACSGADKILGWDSFSLAAPPSAAFSSATLTIKNSAGVPISGWIGRPLDGNQPLDLSTLTLEQTGQTPDFDVALADLTDMSEASARFRVLAPTPELCWSVNTQATCPASGGLLPSPLPNTASTVVTASGSAALPDEPEVTLQTATSELTVPGETRAELCGASLSGTLTGPDALPIPGARVELLDADSNPVQSGDDPVVVVSDDEGTFSFPPLLVGSYRLRVNTVRDRWAVSDLTVLAGGTGTAVASADQVTSSVITLTSGLAGEARATFTGPIDDDGDGLPNYIEKGADLDQPVDSDGDTLPDYLDLDSDNDGILDATERGEDGHAPRDSDGDGIPDYQDLDSDDDLISDAYEAVPDPERALDENGALAGLIDLTNGIPLAVQTEPGSGVLNYIPNDQDGDQIPDYLSGDSDGDGVSDRLERGTGGAPINTDRNAPGGDDLPDYLDLDSDADSISDRVESNFDGSPVDTDNDGTPDRIDTDSDNDGIPDRIELDVDQDDDTISNYRDRDSDGDGISDRREGNLHGDDDTQPNYLDLDSDNDTIPDSVEQGDRAELLDTDGDQLPNYLDTDSDDDGIPDAIEVGPNPQFPRDSDGDGTPDYLDADSDNDTIPDAVERGTGDTPVDSDQDGIPDYIDSDSDNDNVKDRTEAGPAGATPRDTDGDTVPDYLDTDSDDDGISDAAERGSGSTLADTDKDGTPDLIDDDSDGDGISDLKEGTADPDGDTIGNWRDLDSDGDQISDALETDGDDDGDNTPNYLDSDSDNDTVRDSVEAGPDPSSPRDSDGDGIPDYRDEDSDNDCLPDRLESATGILVATAPSPNASDNCSEAGFDRCDTSLGQCTRGCALDADCGDESSGRICDAFSRSCVDGCRSEGNGCPEGVACEVGQGGVGRCLIDSDGDKIPDVVEQELGLDPQSQDSDGDGIPDTVEAANGAAIDTDGDGLLDALDTDSDNDGLADRIESGDDPTRPRDTDQDGLPDYVDLDSDGDGWADAVERAADSDGDGVPDYIDLDSDDDGVSDADELVWGLARTLMDSDSDGIRDGDEFGPGPGAADSDGDGTPDALDLDSDNDGIPDQLERGDGDAPLDFDQDGTPDFLDLDSDDDGIPDQVEARDSRDQIADSDGDGSYDFRDLDSDDDGLSDQSEGNVDTDGDGVPDFRDLDSDNDCLSDQAEAEEQTQLEAERPSALASDNCPAEAPICAPRSGSCVTAERALPRDCTEENATSVCLSGACDLEANKCVPLGCSSDAACEPGLYCDGNTMTCVTQLSTGDLLLADVVHGSECSEELAAKMCESGACNPYTNRCANRDGARCKEPADCASNACVEGRCVSERVVPTVERLEGGCSAPGGATGDITGILLGALWLWLRRRRSTGLAALLLLAALCTAGRAHAQRGYSVNLLEVSERGSEWFSADSLDLRGKVRPAIGLVGEWAYRPLTAHTADGERVLSIVRNQFVLHAGASLVLVDRLRLGVDLPIQGFVDGRAATLDGATIPAPRDEASLGDLRLALDVRLFGRHGGVITGALGVRVSLPTGDRDTYAGDGRARITPQFQLAGELGHFVWAGRVAVNIRTEEERFADLYLDTFLSYSLAVGVRALSRRLVIGPELFAHTSLTNDQFFKKRSTPTELMLGAHYTAAEGLRLGAGFGFGVSAGYGAPQHRGLLSLEWTPFVEEEAPPPPDRDGDGIADCDDACSYAAGPRSSDPARNGCPPEPADRDRDSVLDEEDACPNQAGVTSDDPQRNGCPPPPPDRDQDGILDGDDACPDEAGEPNSDCAQNGCPPPKDSDGDGVLDPEDACPNDKGLADPDPKRNGCPKAYLIGDQIKILDQVKFKVNSAEIVPGQESQDVLLAVLGVLNAHPEVKLVQIEGHTDNTGSAKRNRELSKSRAESVRSWLVKKGIEPGRLTAAGFGPDKPIDSNDTEAGRRNNRRVEFHITASTPAASVVVVPGENTPAEVIPLEPIPKEDVPDAP